MRYCYDDLNLYSMMISQRRSQFWSMSHVVYENKSIYFLIRFAQTKITLFIFVNNWIIRENESFLIVEPCSRVPNSRGNGEHHDKFPRLKTLIKDYFQHTRILSNFTMLNQFVYLFIYLFSCLYSSLWKWIPLNFRIFLRGPGNISVVLMDKFY